MSGITPQPETIASIPVWTCGAGNTSILIVHGGPGLNHSYLVEPLLPLTTSSRLIFYDQHFRAAASSTDTSHISDLIQDLKGLLVALSDKGRVGILTHSWGTYLAFAVMAGELLPHLAFSILVSPVGLTKGRFDATGERLVARIPQEVRDTVDALAAKGEDVAMMAALFPYYLAKNSRRMDSCVTWYNNAVNEAFLQQVPDYDYRHIGSRLPASTMLVYGDEDVEVPDATREIHSQVELQVIPGAGHFAFCEQPAAFQRIVADFLAKIVRHRSGA